MQNELKELTQKILQWQTERNFFCPDNGTNIEAQFYKFLEENGEMHSNLLRQRTPKDDIGDQFVVLVGLNRLCKYDFHDFYETIYMMPVIKPVLMLTMYLGTTAKNLIEFKNISGGRFNSVLRCLNQIAIDNNLTLLECVEHAYNEIKDRKGKMINNVFVKESDL